MQELGDSFGGRGQAGNTAATAKQQVIIASAIDKSSPFDAQDLIINMAQLIQHLLRFPRAYCAVVGRTRFVQNA